MEPIYVTGHKNPDTDAICSAIAYAALRNSLGEKEYVASRIGNLSDETKNVLKKFGVEAPVLINTVRTQVKDLNYDNPPALNKSATVFRAWDTLKSLDSIAVIPVVDDDEKLFGMLTSSDIAKFAMKTVGDPCISDLPIYNLLSVLEGQIVNKVENIPEEISGELCVALPSSEDSLKYAEPNKIVICGQQIDSIMAAVKAGVKAIVVCESEINDEIRNIESDTVIIATPFDAYRASRRIMLAIPIERISTNENVISFNLDDFIDDVEEVLLKKRFRAYPIIDDERHVIGTIGRFHLIKPKRKKVVLVDHNEISQSVPGLQQAEVVAIIDHHRIGDIQTNGPIAFRNEPLGSSATIVGKMYQELGVMPSKKIAGIICSAILSDTVMFKSPTATDTDRVIAERMSKIAGVTIEEIGDTVFSGGGGHKSVEELIFTDFKEFKMGESTVAVGQYTCLNSEKIAAKRDEILSVMKAKKEENGYRMLLFMLTDVIKEGTELFFVGDEEVYEQAYGAKPENNSAFLPGVMSRKKEIIPPLSEIWG